MEMWVRVAVKEVDCTLISQSPWAPVRTSSGRLPKEKGGGLWAKRKCDLHSEGRDHWLALCKWEKASTHCPTLQQHVSHPPAQATPYIVLAQEQINVVSKAWVGQQHDSISQTYMCNTSSRGHRDAECLDYDGLQRWVLAHWWYNP